MNGAMELLSLKDAAIVLCAAGLVVPVFYRLRISSVLGFMIVGMAVGPFGLGALADDMPWLRHMTITGHSGIHGVAELGVILLMFMIGLELSFERIMTMKRLIFGIGLLQVVLSAGVLIGAGVAFGLPMKTAVVLGLGLAMSSTAIIIQVLAERHQIATGLGRTTFSVLLFQDVAVVPVLFIVGVLASRRAANMGEQLAVGIIEAIIAVAALILVGRRILRPLFRMVAATRSAEMFMAACLLIVMTASLTTYFVGLSLAMGALIAGLLLAETEYRRQIEVSIEPFKGLLLGIFLISIGLSANLGLAISNPLGVLGGVIGLIALKAAIVTGLGWLFRIPWHTALRAGLLLGPGSEFTFVILGLAMGYNLVEPETGQYALLLTVLTMTLIPVLEWLGRLIGDNAAARNPALPEEAQVAVPHGETPQVLIAGFGRVGQMVASLLEAHRISYIAIDSDPELVAVLRRQGRPVYYGDMARIDFLRHAGIETAAGLVVTMGHPASVEVLVAIARAERPDLLIVARARDAEQAARLYRAGATDAVPETLEASLQLGETLLVDLGVPMGRVIASVHERRAELREEIQSLAPDRQVRTHARRRAGPSSEAGG
ncbi:MAG TPA: cation:proton antiporter [Pedomonas sp.]|uniref:cation:proton antiporter domain-containing protein n=1 Tax=Pedomonas sp. TaxID=2976421 RepID=UPI002F3FD4EC